MCSINPHQSSDSRCQARYHLNFVGAIVLLPARPFTSVFKKKGEKRHMMGDLETNCSLMIINSRYVAD